MSNDTFDEDANIAELASLGSKILEKLYHIDLQKSKYEQFKELKKHHGIELDLTRNENIILGLLWTVDGMHNSAFILGMYYDDFEKDAYPLACATLALWVVKQNQDITSEDDAEEVILSKVVKPLVKLHKS